MTNEIKEILTSMHYAGHTFASYRMKNEASSRADEDDDYYWSLCDCLRKLKELKEEGKE